MAKIGSFSTRTETCEKDVCKFKKNLKLVFGQEIEITFEVWDEDLVNHDKLLTKTIPIKDFKEAGEMKITLSKEGEKPTELKFKYETINVVPLKKENAPEKPK